MPTRDSLHVHVLIDSLTWGGAETLLADYAVGAQAAGIQVSVGYLNDRSAVAGRLRDVGVEPRLVGIRSLLRKADRALVRDHLAQVGPDLLHTHLGYSDLLGGLAARALGLPTVSTIHVMHWEDALREKTKDRLMALARRRTAYRVLTVSDAARQTYLDAGWDRPEHVMTVHNGIVGDHTPGARERIRAELGLAPDDVAMVMVSVLRRGKGHEVAGEALRALGASYPQLRLVALGEGPDRDEIEATLAPLGDRVLLPGHRDDVLDVLDAADILIHPSRFDAFPTALLEAGAAGVPAIATGVGGIPEIVTDGDNGILIPAPPTAEGLAGALETLLADPELRARMGARGRERFEQSFTVDRWMERLLPIYDAALASRSPSDAPDRLEELPRQA